MNRTNLPDSDYKEDRSNNNDSDVAARRLSVVVTLLESGNWRPMDHRNAEV